MLAVDDDLTSGWSDAELHRLESLLERWAHAAPTAARMSPMTEHLFSYGTLQDPKVQRATFGRELAMTPDALPAYRTELIEIHDADVVRTSGLAHHPGLVATGDAADVVAGSVLRLTPDELAAADAYEVDDYVRAAVTLASGATAWAYVSRAHRLTT